MKFVKLLLEILFIIYFELSFVFTAKILFTRPDTVKGKEIYSGGQTPTIEGKLGIGFELQGKLLNQGGKELNNSKNTTLNTLQPLRSVNISKEDKLGEELGGRQRTTDQKNGTLNLTNGGHKFPSSDHESFDSQFKINYSPSHDDKTIYNIPAAVNLDLGPKNLSTHVTHIRDANLTITKSNRPRRNVFGKDNRIHIPSKNLAQLFPFLSVVRLGRGCTGTLIWKRHVLTAAHCVHDGQKYRPPLFQLKVGLLRQDGTFKWLKVKRAFIPNAWFRKSGLGKIAHDYAVLELERPHGRPWMMFGWHGTKRGQIVQFAGFPADKPVNEMWFSYCSVVKLSRNIFLNYCDAVPGMSGSGVYVYDQNAFPKRYSRRVVAVFSSYVKWKRRDGRMRFASNAATRLTLKKVDKICQWMKAGKHCLKLKVDSLFMNQGI